MLYLNKIVTLPTKKNTSLLRPILQIGNLKTEKFLSTSLSSHSALMCRPNFNLLHRTRFFHFLSIVPRARHLHHCFIDTLKKSLDQPLGTSLVDYVIGFDKAQRRAMAARSPCPLCGCFGRSPPTHSRNFLRPRSCECPRARTRVRVRWQISMYVFARLEARGRWRFSHLRAKWSVLPSPPATQLLLLYKFKLHRAEKGVSTTRGRWRPRSNRKL